MNFFSSGLDALRHLRTAALAASVVVLAACGSNITSGDVSGTAAVGAPLANATVSLLCASGGTPTTATTSSAGKYNMSLGSSCAAPYFLKVVGIDTSVTPNVTTTLYAFADAAGNVNITPLTDIAARFATGNNPEAEFEAVKAASKKAGDLWNSASATEGKAKLLETLAGLGLNTSGINDVLHGAFNAVKGDKTDDLLEALKTKRGGVSLADLADKALKLGGSPGDKPWNALFRVGQNEIKLNLTGCQFYQYRYTYSPGDMPATSQIQTTVTSAVLTLTRNGNSLTASITPNAADTTQTFASMVIGQIMAQNQSAEFQLSMRPGTTTYVNVRSNQNSYPNRSVGFDLEPQSEKKARPAVAVLDESPIYSGQSLSFYDNEYISGVSDSQMSLNCDTVSNPLTRSNVGSLQPQSRLASIASVSPSMTLTSALANDAVDGVCQIRTYNGMENVVTGTYTYVVSADGAIAINGANLGDFLSSSAYPDSSYYERTGFNSDGVESRNLGIQLDNSYYGLYVYRSIEGDARQFCNGD